MAKTYSQKPAEVTRKWYVLDASQTSMGRLATVAARLLIGKDKPTITAHVDGGDYVVIINADKLVVSGGKEEKKVYYNHSGFPGGLRERQLKEVAPAEALTHAIRGMLPVNKLRDGRLARLKIYAGTEHNHAAQQPEAYDLQKGNK
jgi:large subunit ribosomal protein L13